MINVIPQHNESGVDYPYGFDPSCVFDRSGNAYYCYIARPTNPGSQDLGPVHLSKTSDNGALWDHVRVSPSLVSQDKPFIAIDNTGGTYNGRIYVSWVDFANNQNKIKFAVSVDGGATFPTVIDLVTNAGFTPTPNAYAEPSTSTSSDPIIGPLVQGPVPAVAPNGDVYVVWFNTTGGTGSNAAIEVRKGIPSSLPNSPYISFPDPAVTAANIKVVWGRRLNLGWYRVASWPTIAIDQNTGYIYVAWTEFDTGDNLNIYYARSTNNGQSFGPKAIATDPAYNSYAQFFPWLSVDPTGRVGLVFCDNRHDPAPTSAPPWIDVYFTESGNNGSSFTAPNVRITSTSSNANSANITTDYQGLTSTVGFFFPAYHGQSGIADVYFARVNRAPTSNAATATAGNGQRKLARESNGNYHQVFETNQEIWYASKTTTDTEWNNYQRLSNGIGDGNTFPCIAERSSKLYVVWQRKTGTNTYDIYFRYFNGTSWGTIQSVSNGVSVTNDPLPVITSPNTSELMVVYRSGNNLEWKRSTNDGGAWPTSGTLNAGSGETLNSPSAGATITPWSARRTGLAYATKEIPNASHIITHYHDGSAWSASNNISSSLPGSLSQHAHPSLAPSGDATSPWYVHVAWDAYDSQYSSRVIIHRFASTADWNFGSQYHELHYQTEDRPSISGLAGNTAHMVYNRGTNYYHLNAHFNGSGWSVQFPAISGFNPSLSIGNTSAKYVWTDGASSPYTINLSASSFQKSAKSDSMFVDYHRSVAVVDTITGAWFDVRVEDMTITTTARTQSAISLIDIDPSSAITPANAFDGLSSQSIVMPATAESLMVSFAISGDKLSAVKNGVSPLRVELMIVEKSGNITNVSVFLTNVESLPKTKRNIALAASAFMGKEITLKPQVTGIAGKSSLVASLGHIYEIIAVPTSKNVKKIADTATRQDFALKAYPNPFNPSTQIRFSMKGDGIATLRIYNLHGQFIRELLHERRAAGEHIVTWDGRDERGTVAASGVYFIRFEAGNEVKIGKIMLVR